MKLGIIGLNSAFLQLTGGDYTGRLDLHVRQLHGVCGGDAPMWIRQHHAALLLTHHPLGWLHTSSQEHFKAEIYSSGRFTLHLFGHMHEFSAESIRIAGAPHRRFLQGTSLFGLETWEDKSGRRENREHGYSSGSISVETTNGALRIWPRRTEDMHDGGRKIVPDQRFDLTDESISETFLVKNIIESSPAKETSHKPLESEKHKDRERVPISSVYNLGNTVFYVPYHRKGNRVIGREEALQKVRQQLTSDYRTSIGQAVAFQGLGGLGKTQLAVEYAHEFKEEYPNGIIWINADQDTDAQLIEVVDFAKWIAPESEHKDKLAVAQQRLRAYGQCLVILDNVESIESIEHVLKLINDDSHILATSRVELIGFDTILLDTLDKSLSYTLLIQESGRKPNSKEEEDAAREIVKKLDGLPLALELAGAYLRYRPSVSWQQYLNLFNHNLSDAFPNRFHRTSFTKHEADLYSTLSINEQLFSEEPRLREILDLLTWSASAAMGKDLLCKLLGVNDFAELINALSLGIKLRLLQETVASERYSIHRLLRKVRRDVTPLADNQEWVITTCERVGNWFQDLKEDFQQLPRFEAEIDHLQAWQANAVQFAQAHASRLKWLQAYPPFHRGRYGSSRTLLDKALELFYQHNENQNDNGGQNELKAHLLSDLSAIHNLLSDSQSALKYGKEALEIRKFVLGINNPDTASSFNSVGHAYGNLGEYNKQLEYAQKALDIRLEVLGEHDPHTASSFNSVGNTYGYLGKYDKQIECHQKALDIYQKVFGERHPHTAASFNNVGNAYGNLGKYDKQLEYVQKALDISLEILGEHHPNTVTSLSNAGIAYGKLGKYDKQLEYQQKALNLRLEVFGGNHPDTASSFNNTGGAYGDLGKYDKQLEYQQKALTISIGLFGERHPDTANLFNNVGNAYGKLGKYDKQLEYQQKALNLRLEVFGGNHPDTAISFYGLSFAYERLGNRKKALECIKKAIEVNRIIIEYDHPDSIHAAMRQALLLRHNSPIQAFHVLDDLLKKLPSNHSMYEEVKALKQEFDANVQRPGFRQAPKKKKKKRR